MTEEEWDALKPGDAVRAEWGSSNIHIICSKYTDGYTIEDGTQITLHNIWDKIGYIVGAPGTKFAGMNPEFSRNSDFERRLDTEL
jgi:hypothetical protein